MQRRNDLLLTTLKAAFIEMEKLQGSDPKVWQWGKLHHNFNEHAFSRIVDESMRAKLDVGPIAKHGSEFTPNQSAYRLTDFRQTGGPSFRIVVDVGNWDNSRAMNHPGQSGDPENAHYRDLAPLWRRGEYFPLRYSRKAVEQETEQHHPLDTLQASRTRPFGSRRERGRLARSGCQMPECVVAVLGASNCFTFPSSRFGVHALLNIRFSASLFVLLLFSSGCRARTVGPPFAPKEALTTFRLSEGFRIELVAAEPDVADPVAIAFDPQGRIYVVEMIDYPDEREPEGRIRLLEDRDEDGHFETSFVFADGFHFPTGVMPWKDGILVAAAPDIFYLVDTDGDHRADKRQVLLSGFNPFNPQLRVNGLLYGIDNWIYGAYPEVWTFATQP